MEKTEKFDWENDAREKQKQEIASIKGRELVLRLSDQDVEEICELTGRYGTTVEELLENFVGDLIDGTYCNGSDEHEYARRWFERCDLGMFPETDFVSYMLNSYGSDRVDVLIGCQEELQEVENEISKSKEQLLEYQNKLNDSSYDWEREVAERAVRGHWMVESYHWHLDVTFREDGNHTLEKQAAYNLNIIRKLALNILKIAEVGRRPLSMKKKRYAIGTNPEKYLDELMNL